MSILLTKIFKVMKTKTIVVALATLLIGSLCFLACQKDEGLPVKPDVAEIMDLKAGPAHPVMVPFKGKGNWQAVDFLFPYPEGVMEMYVVVEFEGTATHLGRFEAVWTGLYEFIMVDEMPVPTVYLSSYTIYTAANGDELYDEGCVDNGTEYFPDDDGIGFFMTGSRIVGGTGRFEGAEGWYDILVESTVGFPFPAGTWELEGEISFARPMVPFKGSGTWQYAAPPDIGDEVVIIAVLLEGTATHLGRLEALWTARFDYDEDGVLGFIGDYLSHSNIFTAANRDRLDAEGDASTGTQHNFYEPLGTGFLMTGVRIVGGTGRFKNAEGLYDLSVNVSEDDPFVGTWEIEGEISRRGR
jgi:hypothetical protein